MEPQDDRPVELRIKAPGWRHYGGAFLLWLLGVVLAAFYWGAEALVLVHGPDYTIGGIHHRAGIVNQLRAVIFGGAGVLLALGVPLFIVAETIESWRHWRRLRQPDTVINAAGIRFEASRRPLTIAWREVERLELDRKVYRYRARRKILSSKIKAGVRTKSALRVRLLSGSPVLSTGLGPIPADRWFRIGVIENRTDIPYDDVVEFLKRTAEPYLEIKERSEWIRGGPQDQSGPPG